jgi:hypothetical protein
MPDAVGKERLHTEGTPMYIMPLARVRMELPSTPLYLTMTAKFPPHNQNQAANEIHGKVGHHWDEGLRVDAI